MCNFVILPYTIQFMQVQQLYTSCLSEAAYFIHSNQEAAVIDPLRDIDEYLKLAAATGTTIKYIFETHFHADFVSGHLELAQKTGATIIYGPNANPKFPCHIAKDGEVFKLGDCTLTAIHTPGHTLESTCYLLSDDQQNPYSIFTGDTLFVGDVGRPDLFSGNLSKEELATMLYHSLNTKIKTLPDHVILYPAHGPGSACGKKLGSETYSTIGAQKITNYALQPLSVEEFVQQVTDGLSEPPPYFPINARINKEGYTSFDEVKEKGMKPLSIDEFKTAFSNGAFILDTRKAVEFTQAFIPGSVNIGLEGRFAEWVGILIPFNQDILLVCDDDKVEESITRLARIGYDNVIGYLNGGVEAWSKSNEPLDMIIDIDVDEFAMDIPFDENMEILDVRKEGEFNGGHVIGANNVPLQEFNDILKIASIDTDKNLYVHCAGGYRSVIAASILKKQGFHNLRNILGGFSAIKDDKRIDLQQITQSN
jgi:hydroxyacylglutathione hydrolase